MRGAFGLEQHPAVDEGLEEVVPRGAPMGPVTRRLTGGSGGSRQGSP